MDEPWRIELLGWLRAAQGRRVVSRFQTQKTAALLAYLAYFRGRTHAREELTELLWPGCEPEQGRTSLRQALSSLRRQLEPPGVPAGAVIVANRQTVELSSTAATTDVAELDAALEAAARAGGGLGAARELERAVGLYRGELLPGLYQDWIGPERERLRGAFLGATRALIAHLVAARDFGRAVAFARRAAAADPASEEARRDLMRALAGAGQAAEALRQYRDLARVLEREVGVAPQAATRELARDIERRAPPATTPAAAPPPAAARGVGAPAGLVTLVIADPSPVLREGALREEGGFLCAEFARPQEALRAALDVAAAAARAGGASPRLALETGEAAGEALERAAALLRAAHAGEILCSARTAALLPPDPGAGLALADLGLFRLAGAAAPERIFELRHPGRPAQGFPPPLAAPGRTARLPLRLTRFFGRAEELARLEATIGTGGARLVTLTGPGGTGKTRLAIELGARLCGRLAGAVWFAPLADLADPTLVPGAILDAMRIECAPGRAPLDEIARALGGDRALLILDNFEQLAAEGAAIVRDLLERAPGLACLVTSRERLRLSGEVELPVPPLPTPDGGRGPEELAALPSVELFLDRAQAVRPDFQVTGANAAAVAELCRRLDGIPLAVELAAGRAAVLNPAQMLERLASHGLGAPVGLDLLVSRDRDAPARHRTLRAAIDWSRALLPPELARFFARLAVLRGGFGLEAAEAIASEREGLALESLARLRECSLVEVEGEGRETRFRLLETIREYAAEAVPEEERAALARRHAAYFAALAERAAPGLDGPDQAAFFDRLAAEEENFRAALRACAADPTLLETGLRLGAALWRFWQVRGRAAEGRRLLEALLARAPGRSAARALGLRAAGVLAASENDLGAARVLLEESLAILRALGDRAGAVKALNGLGAVASSGGDLDGARAFYEEALALARALGDRRGAAILLNNLGVTAWARGECAAARGQIEEALAIERELGNRLVVGMSQDNLGLLAIDRGDFARARTSIEEAMAIFREVGYARGVAQSLVHLARMRVAEGDGPGARALAEEGLAEYRRLGLREGVAYGLFVLAGASLADGDCERARALGEECLALARAAGDSRREAEVERVLGEAAGGGGEGAGDAAAARAHYAAGLGAIRALGEVRSVIAGCLEGLAALEPPARAARLLGAAGALREALGAPLPPRERGAEAACRKAARAALGADAFGEAFERGRAQPWEKALEGDTTEPAPRRPRADARPRPRPGRRRRDR
jgi:non-specific serine/threonine protein kinase